MALIGCPDCGRKVSDLAVACPDCARPIASLLRLSRSDDGDAKQRASSRRDMPRPEGPKLFEGEPGEVHSGRCVSCKEMILGADPEDGAYVCIDCREAKLARAELRRMSLRRVVISVIVILVVLGIGVAAFRLLSFKPSDRDPVAPHT